MYKIKLNNRRGSYMKHTFILDYDYQPELYCDESKHLWNQIIQQAIDDYIMYKFSRNIKERSMHYAAKDFLFDDHYKFMFGTKEINLRELLDLFDINIDWVRLGIVKKEQDANKNGTYQPGTQLSLF